MKEPKLSFEDLPLAVGTLVAMAMVDGRVLGPEEIHSRYNALIAGLTTQKDQLDFDKMCTAIGMALVEHVFLTILGN